MVETGQEYDLKFKTPTSSFKNFLGIIPAAYAFRQCENNWRFFTVMGFAKAYIQIQRFRNLILKSHPITLLLNILTPKTVENIVIDTKIINETGILNDTYVNLEKLSFRLIKMFLMPKPTLETSHKTYC
jgi:hypothetical protein